MRTAGQPALCRQKDATTEGRPKEDFFAAGFFSKERGTQPDECPAPAQWGGTINDARQPKNEKRGSRITSDIPTVATDEPRHDAQKRARS